MVGIHARLSHHRSHGSGGAEHVGTDLDPPTTTLPGMVRTQPGDAAAGTAAQVGFARPRQACTSGSIHPGAARSGKFVIKRGRGGKTRFVRLASNGRVVATSDTYDSKESCLKGIAAVKRLAADAAVVDAVSPPTKPGSKPGRSSPPPNIASGR